MFEIKLSQGAKPGKGGILPGIKVTEEIAAIRGIPAGKDSISPNRHPEIRDAASLLDMLDRVRTITRKPVGFKAVFGGYQWLEEFLQLVNARGEEHAPDFITVDSGDGGTGAAPQALIDNVGLPLRESLPVVVDLVHKYGLKGRTHVVASGKLVNPEYVAAAFCQGADFVTSARGFMFALGCIQALQCNKNTCPTGITTHNERLQRGLVPADKAERVYRYQKLVEKEIATIAHSCGVARPRLLRREHARIVQDNGLSIPMNELYPGTYSEMQRREQGRIPV
jgi:glutamate synthase domain-containing protein 2